MRLLVGLLFVTILAMTLPTSENGRIWVFVLCSFLAPWLVLGRDEQRLDEGVRLALRYSSGTRYLVLLELVVPLVVIAVGCILALGTQLTCALALFFWAAFLVTTADALDRYFGRAGPAWVCLLLVILPFFLAPLWMGPWFGQEPFAPYLATGVIRLHPVAVAFSAAEMNTLKDPIFYQTLGVHLEVRPLHWLWSTFVFASLGCAGAFAAVKASMREPRSLALRG